MKRTEVSSDRNKREFILWKPWLKLNELGMQDADGGIPILEHEKREDIYTGDVKLSGLKLDLSLFLSYFYDGVVKEKNFKCIK